VSTTSVDHPTNKRLREQLRARYFVQWVTKFDSNNHIIDVLGHCVRDRDISGWPTVFQHKEHNVCQKIADMLNEGS